METPQNIAQIVGLYRALRQSIKRMDDDHKTKMEVKRGQLLSLGGMLEKFLRDTGQDGASTPEGSFYTSTRFTASVTDAEGFMNYVREADAWDLLEKRANATALRDHVHKYNGLPPGVKLSQHTSIGVRAPKGGGAAGEEEEK